MSWGYRVTPYYAGAGGISNTLITPNTGALATAGQDAHVRPIHGNAGSMAITGQPIRTIVGIRPATGALGLAGQPAVAATQSQIISAEYIGDGTGPRSFTSYGFAPLFVIVVGKDGSGNVVGALKSPFMPSGESQPFQENIAQGGAARLNRITSIDANGFTVGSDLNVTGRNYAYVMFPAGRFGAVTQGTYTGNSASAPGHASLVISASEIHGNPSGATQFVKPQYCTPTWYHPAGSTPYVAGVTPLVLGGRRMIRNSDGAILAEATFYNNDSSCDGIGYILGNESNWHWEEQYIELHTLVPDMLLLVVDDQTGQGIPATIVPPPTDSGTGWSGNSLSEPAFFASNTEAVLHIPDTGGLGHNQDGKVYHWFALKGDLLGSGGVRMKSFQYTGTGDGPYPIELTGCGFDPEWAYLQRDGDQFHWSKRTRNILGAHTSRRWLDGTGDHILVNPEYTVDFIPDGIQFPATNSIWNQSGQEYTVTLIGISDPVANPPNTGSLAFTGYAPVLKTQRAITPNTGALTLTGQTPIVTRRITTITPNTGSLSASGQTAAERTNFLRRPFTGSLALTGLPPIVVRKEMKTLQTGALSLVGQQPTLRTDVVTLITPAAGALVVEGQDAEIRTDTIFDITPQTGHLNITGQGPSVRPVSTGQGALAITGQPVVLRHITFITPGTGSMGGGECQCNFPITPNTGALNFVGQPCIVEVTVVPIPQIVKPLASGGVGFPHPRKLPFWPKKVIIARGKMIEPAATFSGRGRCEENELAFFGLPPSDGTD